MPPPLPRLVRDVEPLRPQRRGLRSRRRERAPPYRTRRQPPRCESSSHIPPRASLSVGNELYVKGVASEGNGRPTGSARSGVAGDPGATGSEIVNVAPRPSSLTTDAVPPRESTIDATIASPSPAPPLILVRDRSAR